MKCFFTISSGDHEYYEMAKVLVLSALDNTDLELYCVYDGQENYFTKWLQLKSVIVLPWKITFLKDLKKIYDGKKSIRFCRGTYLCMELPIIISAYNITDDFVLYVDTDVMFNGSIELNNQHPKLFSSSTDWEVDSWLRFSTGVIVMNTKKLRMQYPKFLIHLQTHNYNFEFAKMGPCDQGAWNTFYTGKNEKLDQVYDWKPWWGVNKNARIIHFSGPKPNLVDRILNQNELETLTELEYRYKFVVNENIRAYRTYLKRWKYYSQSEKLKKIL